MTKNNKRSFTLIELIIVMIINGILASVAVPMITGMKARAMCSEAVTTMCLIRGAVRTHCVENPRYSYSNYLSEGVAELGLKPNDIQGTYFSKECYFLGCSGPSGLIACILPQDESLAPKAIDANAIPDGSGGYLTMNIQTGEILQHGISRSGYREDTNSSVTVRMWI